ncbi:MAG: hypothetical protein AAF668_14690 [Pseudomonadota bacterium]
MKKVIIASATAVAFVGTALADTEVITVTGVVPNIISVNVDADSVGISVAPDADINDFTGFTVQNNDGDAYSFTVDSTFSLSNGIDSLGFALDVDEITDTFGFGQTVDDGDCDVGGTTVGDNFQSSTITVNVNSIDVCAYDLDMQINDGENVSSGTYETTITVSVSA